MSATAVNSKAFTTTDGSCTGTSYYGGTVVGGAAATLVLIRRGTVSGAIIDAFSVGINLSESHDLTNPIGCPEGIFVDVDANTAHALIRYE